jgi:5'-nucleotidase/UDP-sugar diphosphatase
LSPPRDPRAARGAAVALAAAALAACTVTSEPPNLWGQDVALTILHTSDIHSRMYPYDFQPNTTDQNLGLRADAPPYGGVARLGALLSRERSRTARSIHLDSGDCFQGAPVFNQNLGEVEVRWLSAMHADAVVIGNHEFDAGVANLAKQYDLWGTYPLLSANYDWYDWRDPRFTELGRLTQPYTVIDAGGLKVGIIGLANISSLNSIGEDQNSLQVTPTEQNETTRAWAEFLAPSVDLLGVVSHLGLEEDQWLVQGHVLTYEKKDIEPFLAREHDPWEVLEEYPDGKVRVRIPGVRNLDFIAGGHLHVVTNPPQELTDRDGRKVLLVHSGAFAKYLGRLDVVVRMPPPPGERTAEQEWRGGEIVAHDYYAFPTDSVWCHDHRTTPELHPEADLELAAEFVRRERPVCARQEDPATLYLLDEYTANLNVEFDLTRIFAYAPREILRRNSATGGDAPLGNITAESMMLRRRVEAEFAVTNTLGIRDAMYRGPVTIESMFNIFPFENTINVMYLSGEEVQEMMDFVAERSAGRGCQSQAQIAGMRFVMDCAQVLRNEELRTCRDSAAECLRPGEEDPGWECRSGTCWAHPARNITVNGEPISRATSYKLATNDYIAKGGSGFTVLERNTTRIETGVSLRDALIDHLQKSYCTCNQLLAASRELGPEGAAAACPATTVVEDGARIVDPLAMNFCENALAFRTLYREGGDLLAETAPRVYAGKCDCNDVLAGGDRAAERCGHVTPSLEAFCEDPLQVPVVIGVEDDRISRRLQ